jgi:hypothetical protein
MLTINTEPAFYEAQAVVLSKMGQHKQALEIYVFKMKDYQKAEQWVFTDIPDLPLLTSTDTATELTRLKTPYHLNRIPKMMERIPKRPRLLFTIRFYRSIFSHHHPTSPT